jgi:hypothetical protein
MAPANSARKNSCVPIGPIKDKETGSLFETTARVNFKNGQHNRSFEMNSAILEINPASF